MVQVKPQQGKFDGPAVKVRTACTKAPEEDTITAIRTVICVAHTDQLLFTASCRPNTQPDSPHNHTHIDIEYHNQVQPVHDRSSPVQ